MAPLQKKFIENYQGKYHRKLKLEIHFSDENAGRSVSAENNVFGHLGVSQGNLPDTPETLFSALTERPAFSSEK